MKVSGRLPRAAMLLALCAVVLAGCGTISGHSQNCSSSGGLFSENSVRCEGTADTLGGKMGIEFGDDDDFDGEYRLEASVSVERGEAEVLAGDDEIPAGRVSAGEPVVIDEVVELSEDSMVFTLDAGEDREVNGLSYDGTVTPR
jgi:predicted small secreted protein